MKVYVDHTHLGRRVTGIERITTELLMVEHGLVRSSQASCQLPPYYTGNHAARAFAVAVGPDVPQGIEHAGRDVMDLAPTILDEFGIDRPPHMGGALLRELHGTTPRDV